MLEQFLVLGEILIFLSQRGAEFFDLRLQSL
jgi:hypothetical protein